MSRYWTVVDEAGTIMLPCVVTSPAASGPGDEGVAMEDGWQAVAIAGPVDVTAQAWTGTEWAPRLDVLRARAVAKIDTDAEACRARFLTPGTGQAMTYQRKEADARAWLADNTLTSPFLTAEADARGMAMADLATEVVAMADAWATIGAQIEGLRMGAKATVAAASNPDDIAQATAVAWDSVGN